MWHNPYFVICVAVFMHVAWNILTRYADPRANYLWWGLLAHIFVVAPWGFYELVVATKWDATLVVAMAVSSAAISVYFFALRKAYQLAPVALVYPLVRSAPLVIALWSWLLFAKTLTHLEMVAMAISIAGLWLLAATAWRGSARGCLSWAFIAMFATSIYSLSDKVAVLSLQSFGSQLGFISVTYTAAFGCLTAQQKMSTGHYTPALRPKLSMILLGGAFIGTSYALVVRAMQYLPAAHTVAFSNAGIVLAVLVSIFVFREKQHWRLRLLGALVVTAGLALLAMA